MATRKTATAAPQTPSAPTAPARKASRAAAAAQPRGLSLHIGLNSVSPAHYGGWSGDLSACEYDALDLCALAQSKGIKPTLLLTRNGTRAKTLSDRPPPQGRRAELLSLQLMGQSLLLQAIRIEPERRIELLTCCLQVVGRVSTQVRRCPPCPGFRIDVSRNSTPDIRARPEIRETNRETRCSPPWLRWASP